MSHQVKHKNAVNFDRIPVSAEFILACLFAFVAAVLATAYFCRSMNHEMKMPGGWTMSMMWMRMPGQTWLSSALSFLLMWLAMMVAMMLPSALPAFLKTGRKWTSLCFIACGYFTIWLVAGIGIYVVGMAFMKFAMQSELVSDIVPFISGALLIAAGVVQLSRWKIRSLLCCRSPFGCAVALPQQETSFRLGCKQGIACCTCCTAPMLILLILGMMSPLVIIIVAIIIAAEKMLPWPEITTRLVGVAAILAGGITIVRFFGI